MSDFGIGIEADVLAKEVAKSLEQRTFPYRYRQNRAKNRRESAVLIARKAQRPACRLDGLDRRKIVGTKRLEATLPHNIDRTQRQGATHEFVVIHSFARARHARPWRQIVRIALSSIKLSKLFVVGVKLARKL